MKKNTSESRKKYTHLSQAERELYFILYDFFLKNYTEKAVDAIYFWERLEDAWIKN
jgi:hypothetical protein